MAAISEGEVDSTTVAFIHSLELLKTSELNPRVNKRVWGHK